ncbi:HAMP domain-containing sensor histidine kinase [Halobacteriovorax sp. ZH4_bin.1]|uniref:sensor histidine kinase n=1 Tax=unclassified Halobacteriovorax TaxID=2639665 RepID=UPI00371765BB
MKINTNIFKKKLFLASVLAFLLLSISSAYYFSNKNRKAVIELNQRIDLFVSVVGNFGYNGLIHNFKNFVLRSDEGYYNKAVKKFDEIEEAFIRSKDYNLSETELKSLENLFSTAKEYRENLEILKNLDVTLSAEQRDNLVRVDDTQADLAAKEVIRILESKEAQLNDISQNISRFGVAAIVLLILAMASMYYFDLLVLDRTNKKLSQTNEELLQFSYRTSHDLRSPLTTISILCDLIVKSIEKKRFNEDEIKIKVEKIRSRVTHLAELISSLLDLARLDISTHTNEELDFEAMISDIVISNEYLIEKNNIKFSTDVDLSRGHFSQKLRIFQILSNIIVNAVKYYDVNKDEPYVNVEIHDDYNNLYIKVSDNGVGIPCEEKSEVYEQFVRFNEDKSIGSGIGMYIVKKSVDNLGGTIDFSSSSQGTTFKVIIPTDVASANINLTAKDRSSNSLH